MSRTKSTFWLILLILSIFVPPSATQAASPRTYQVQVRETSLRATPSFLGRIIAVVRYGEQVSVLEGKGTWKRVTVSATRKTGWLHGSALTAKALALRSGTQGVRTGAGSSEVALAGKGFNEQVEREFRKKNVSLNFTWVDRMETYRVSPAQMQAFLEGGSLQTSAGGLP